MASGGGVEYGGSPPVSFGRGWRVGPGGGDVENGGGVGSLSFLGVLVTVIAPPVVALGVMEPTGSPLSEDYGEKIDGKVGCLMAQVQAKVR